MRLFKEMFIIGLGILATIYLLNPTAGFIELLPDNLPVIGNLDEGLAVIILLNTFAYYGIDLTRFLRRNDSGQVIPYHSEQPKAQ